MSKFVNQVVFVKDKEYTCEADRAVDELSALVGYMQDYYTNIFDGLRGVIVACNAPVKKEGDIEQS